MERLSRSHPISLPHSGELFVNGCSRRKWKAKVFVLVGTGQGSRAKDYAISQRAFGRVSSSYCAGSQGGFWVA